MREGMHRPMTCRPWQMSKPLPLIPIVSFYDPVFGHEDFEAAGHHWLVLEVCARRGGHGHHLRSFQSPGS